MDTSNFFEDQFVCPVCGSSGIVPAVGSKKSNVLIVAEFPGQEELDKGIPMVGPMGRVLKQELGVLGLDIKQTRRTNLWLHPPNKNKDCFQHGFEEVIKEAKGKQYILLLGDEVVKAFTGEGVMSVAGLVVPCNYFSGIVMCCPNPAIVFQRKGVGEVRLSLKKFVEKINE